MKFVVNTLKKIIPSKRSKIKFAEEPALETNALPLNIDNIKLTAFAKKQISKILNYKHDYKVSTGKKLAIIVPYRNRAEHRSKFVPWMSEYLTKQGIDFEIVIVEQNDQTKPFNRAKLINIGFKEYENKIDYFVIHDIDFLPVDINYNFANYPTRMFNYIDDETGDNVDICSGPNNEIFPHFFSGVVLFPKHFFKEVNGFSNNYWHWGSEDSELLFRCLFAGIPCYFNKQSKVKALPHLKSTTQSADGKHRLKDKAEQDRLKSLVEANGKRYSKYKRMLVDNNTDGLSTLDYKLLSNTIEQESGCNYRLIKVSI